MGCSCLMYVPLPSGATISFRGQCIFHFKSCVAASESWRSTGRGRSFATADRETGVSMRPRRYASAGFDQQIFKEESSSGISLGADERVGKEHPVYCHWGGEWICLLSSRWMQNGCLPAYEQSLDQHPVRCAHRRADCASMRSVGPALSFRRPNHGGQS